MTDLDALVQSVADDPWDEARQDALADYLQDHPGRIRAAVGLLAGWVCMNCSWCSGTGGGGPYGSCNKCNGSGRRDRK